MRRLVEGISMKKVLAKQIMLHDEPSYRHVTTSSKTVATKLRWLLKTENIVEK